MSEWIKTSERLPEPKTRVLACFDSDPEGDDGLVDALWQNWAENPENLVYETFEGPKKAIAWMPLPEPCHEDE